MEAVISKDNNILSETVNMNLGDSQSTNQRRQNILQILQKNDFVRTSQLSELLGVSEVSIRKDMDLLEQKGLIKREHSGARLADNALSLLDFSERYLVNKTAKSQIAQHAGKLIDKHNLCIFIDTGTTNLLLARALPHNLSMTIVTNSFSTVLALEGRP